MTTSPRPLGAPRRPRRWPLVILVPVARAAAVRRVRAAADRAGGLLQPVQVERPQAARPTSSGLANYQKALGDSIFSGALSHNVLIIVLSLVIQIPFALALAVHAERPLPRSRGPPAHLLPAVRALGGHHRDPVLACCSQPDGMVDSVLSTGRPRRAHPGLARQHRPRDAHAVRRHLVEVLRVPHDPDAGRAAGHPARDRGGRR